MELKFPTEDGKYELGTSLFLKNKDSVSQFYKYYFTFDIENSKIIKMHLQFKMFSSNYIGNSVFETFHNNFVDEVEFKSKIYESLLVTNNRTYEYDAYGDCKIVKRM